MSNDQRPARIRAVTGTAQPGAPAEAERAPTEGAGAAIGEHAGAQAAAPRSGPSLVSILLFLIACGAGGGLVAALPFLVAG